MSLHIKKLILTILISSMVLSVFSQGEGNIWYFDHGAGIDFGNGQATVLSDNALSKYQPKVAVMCDRQGNLLFYTNGEQILNKNHQDMMVPKLFPDKGFNSRTSIAIIPKLDTLGQYYVFALTGANSDILKYAVVDMNKNSGLGEVVSVDNTIKDKCGKFTATLHGNGRDFWLVTKDTGIGYLSYLISPEGIAPEPVKNKVGVYEQSAPWNTVTISVDGTRLVNPVIGKGVEVLNFDNLTGKLSNPIEMAQSDKVYAAEFSPSTQFLYLNVDKVIYQYDISRSTIGQIFASEYAVVNITAASSFIMDLRLGKDDKIYTTHYPFDITNLPVIHAPDKRGMACDYQAASFNLSPGSAHFGFCQTLNMYSKKYVLGVNDTCLGSITKLSLPLTDTIAVDSVFWNLDDAGAVNSEYTSSYVEHIFSDTGVYDIEVVYWLKGVDRRINQQVHIINDFPTINLPNDTFFCTGNSVKLGVPFLPSEQKLWSIGGGADSVIIADSGVYWLEIQNDKGCITRDSFEVIENPVFEIDLNDTFSCVGDTFYKNIGSGAEIYSWSNGSSDSIAKFTQAGTYYIDATIGECTSRDSIKIDFHPKPLFNLGLDSVICSTDSITLSGLANVKHQWNNGDTNQSITVKTAGDYILEQSTEYCTFKDTIKIDVQQQPNLNIGTDTVVCIGEKVIIGNPINNGKEYTWSHTTTGTPKVVVDSEDEYSVIADDGVCKAYDTIFVGIYTPQSIELGADSTLCEGTETELDATITRGQYLWNDGVQTPDRTINTTGTYDVKITDSVCSYADTITLTFNPVPPLSLGSDTILCQDEIHQVIVNRDWDKVNWTDGSTDYTRIFTTAGEYKVTVSYLNCQRKDSIQIAYHPPLPEIDLGDDQDVCDPLFVPIEAKGAGYYGYIWQDGTRGNYYEVTQTGDYIVSTLPHRCGQVSDTIHINFLREDCDLHVPNAFTPNGDGDNDYFYPVGHEIEVDRMEIYNRWGELIYNKAEPWDGTYGGKVLPNGSYVYVIHYKKEYRGSKKWMMVKGTVQLLR